MLLLPSACCMSGQARIHKSIPVFRGTEQSGNPASLVLSPGHLGGFNSSVEHRANESCSRNIPTPTTGLFNGIVRRSADARSWIREALVPALLLAVIGAVVPDTVSAQGICSRTDGVENRIMMQLKLIHGFDGTCSDVTNTDLAKLTYLELSGSFSNEAVSSLSRGDFAGLTGVKDLLLWDQSDLRSLPADVFEGLENVEDMWIKPSSIQRISAGAFRGLSKLKLLVIDNDEINEPGEGQRLTNLAPGAFEGLTSLEMLIISDHALNSLPLEELEALRPNPGSLKFYEQRADDADPMLLRVTPMALTIPAGESKTYRIGLTTSAQVYTKVTFNVPEGLTVSPTEVVFPYNHPDWFRRHEITVTVAAGTAPGTLTITHNNTMHNLHELDEPAPAVTITVPGAVAQPTISIDDASGNEGETLDFEVTLSKQTSQTVTVEWDTRGGTATEDVDFTGDLGTLTFLPNETSKTISITTLEDEINDAGEQFTVVLSNPSRATIADGSAVGTINNTDLIPVPEISITDDRVTEGETLEFTVTLDQTFSETVTVDWATAAGSATEDADYTGDSGRLTFAPNEQSKTIEVVTLEDDQNEGSETLTVVLSGASNATIGDGTGVGTIDNKVPDPAISITDARASEGDTLRFTVTLDRTSTEVVTVDWATSAVTATEETDYSGASGRIPFAPNERSKTIEVTTFEDEENEVAETFTVELSNATNATISDASGTGTIDNKVPDPEISISDASASEGETLRFHVTLNRESTSTVTVNWTTTAGTATEDTDYDADNGTLTFNPGDTSKTIEVTTIEDEENEVAETFTVDLSNATNATITDASGTGTINNKVPDPEISISDASASEGETLRFHVTLNRESTNTVTVNWTTTAGTATEDTDYDADNGTLTFNPGDTSKTIEVTTIEDEENEVAETFTVDLSSATNATITDASGTGTINNTEPDPEISITDARASEGETLRFHVTLNRESTSTVTVNWTTTAGTATEDTDYDADNGTLTFNPTETSKTIEVTTIEDEENEVAETFTVDLSSATNATITDASGTGTIDNTEPDPEISITDARASEGETLRFHVTLNRVSTSTVTVNWKTTAGTATEDSDYDADNGTLTFNPTETSKTIEVTTIEDEENEVAETFTVDLSSATNATITDDSGTGTIDNTNSDPAISISDARSSEGETLRFTVTLDKISTNTVTVDWTTTAGTATEDVDYNSGSGQLSFLPTESSKTIEVTAINDELDEALETFTVDLSNPSNATVSDGTATGIIDNTEFVPPPEPGLSIADARGVEGGTLIFQVTLNQVYTNTVTVDWETREGTATEDTDYVGASGQLSFLPGDGIIAIPVLTIDDDHHDDGETFAVVLSNASGAPIVNGTATGTIDNQDVVPGNWIGRFGQAVGELVVKAVQVRMQPPRPPGVVGRIGGHTIQSEDTSSHKRDNDETTRLYGRDPVLQTDPEKFDRYSFSDPEVVPAYIPSDMSFVLTSESADGEGLISVWGQGSWSGFKDADVIDGKATTFMFGIDERKGKWLAGMAIGRSSGEGGWYGRDGGMGSVSMTLTGVYPYIGYNMSEQISIWGVAGYASGDLQVVTPGDQTYDTDVSLAMAAAGTRIEIMQSNGAPGPTIAVLADGMVTSMKSGAVPGLSATDGQRSRLRLGLEGRWTFIQDGSIFEPRLEVSARHDGGDGENGLGIEVGGGLAYSNAADTLIVDISGRSLVMNRNSRFREWGVSASVRYDPRPETDRGLSVSLSQTTGTGPAGSADELMTATAIEDISGGSATRAGSMHAKAGYGLPAFGGSMTGIPWVGYDMSNDTNDVRLGWRLKPARRTKGSFELNTEVQRRAEAEDTEAKYQYGFQIITRW